MDAEVGRFARDERARLRDERHPHEGFRSSASGEEGEKRKRADAETDDGGIHGSPD
jgi:hypothetical protein